MPPEGNLVQIPSSIVYKNNLLNFTSSVSRHEHFAVCIDLAALITEAQEIAHQVVAEHLAVLQDLEHSVRQRTDTASAEGHIWIQVRWRTA